MMTYDRRQEARLVSRVLVADDAYELTFELTVPIRFVPGQYAWLILPEQFSVDTRGSRRAFTIISPSAHDKTLQFVFRYRYPSTEFKQYLITLPIGATVLIDVPFGSHTISQVEAPVRFVAGGVGVSSFLSMIRDMHERNTWRPVSLIYGYRSVSSAPYLAELRAYAKAQPQFELLEVEGPITQKQLAKFLTPNDPLWYVSGPEPMTSSVAASLLRMGVKREHIRCEECRQIYSDQAYQLVEESSLLDSDFYKQAVENASDHMIFTDVEGTILYCNKAAERITGYTLEEMRGSTPRLWGGLMDGAMYQKLWKTIKQEKKPFQGKLRNRKKNGEVYTVIARISPVLGKKGELMGFLGTEEDITDIERIAEERRVSAVRVQAHARELEKINHRLSIEDHAKNEFIATLAHELRNPLAPVVSALELIRLEASGLGNTTLLEQVEVAETHNRTLIHLLDDLMDISRISRKKYKLQKESVDLGVVVRRAVSAVDTLYRSRDETLTVTMPEGVLWVEVDPLRFEQILVNLLNNAAKYTPLGGCISLDIVFDEAKGLRVSVSDNGKGIEQHMLEKIFDPFIQAHDGFNAGLGIGLSLTKRLVELHGGIVWAESEGLGKGSTFVVVMPSTVAQLPLTTPLARRRKGFLFDSNIRPARTYDILVVDDNKQAADGLSLLLRRNHHTVNVVYGGAEAIETMQRKQSEVVLLDIGLPGMNGYDVARSLREQYTDPHRLLLVALTGYGQDDDKVKARQAGFDYHLTKPVTLADVEAVLAKSTLSEA